MPRTPLLLVFCSLLAACGVPHEEPADGGHRLADAGLEFVAVQGDFAGFQDWESFDGGLSPADGLDGGYRRIFLNHRPPSGSSFWPDGTIFVKTTEGAETFAMVKRGGRYNPSSFNWEWVELTESSSGTPLIKWRGKGPDSTPGYGTEAPTGCTGCHMYSFHNDFVAGPVSLTQF